MDGKIESRGKKKQRLFKEAIAEIGSDVLDKMGPCTRVTIEQQLKIHIGNDVDNAMMAFGYLHEFERLLEEGLRAARSIQIIRTRIERFQRAFEMTAGTTAAEMKKVVMAHLKTLKPDMLRSINEKIRDVEIIARKRMIKCFNAKSTPDLVDLTLTKLKDDTIAKIMTFDGFDQEMKEKISQLILDTNVELSGCEKITDQYPILTNSRFIMWVYFFLRCPDPRIDIMEDMIEKDASLNLYFFCAGIAELYTITSIAFHPALRVFSRNELTIIDVIASLENNYKISELSILNSARIVLSVDTEDTA